MNLQNSVFTKILMFYCLRTKKFITFAPRRKEVENGFRKLLAGYHQYLLTITRHQSVQVSIISS